MYLHFTYAHFDSRSWQRDTRNLKEDHYVHYRRLLFEKRQKNSHQNLYPFFELGNLNSLEKRLSLARSLRAKWVDAG